MGQFLQGLFSLIYRPELLKSLFHIAVILVAELLTLRILNSAVKRIWTIVPSGDHTRITRVEQRAETLRHIVGSVGKITLWTMAIITALPEFGINIGPLLAGAGILGLAIGFGAQSLVKDVISGFFILLEDQYGVGDVVRIGDQDGVVEHMTLRTTILRNFDGHVHVIPNGAVASVTVQTRDWARAVVDVTVPHSVEIGRLLSVLDGTGTRLYDEMKDQVIEKPQVLGIEKLSDEGATVRLAVKTLPFRKAEVTRAWRLMVKEAVDREGIALAQKQNN